MVKFANQMLLVILIAGLFCPMGARRQVRVGLLMPYNRTELIPLMGFSTTAGAVMLALDRIRDEHILDDVDFSFYWEDSQCDEAASIGAGTKLILESKVDVILGPPCSAGAFAIAIMTKYYNTAVVGWGASFYEARDLVRFPTYSRTDVGSDDLARAVAEVMDYFQWVEFALMYSDDMLRRECYYIKDGLDIVFADPAYTFISTYPFVVNGSPTTNDYDVFLDAIKPRARIVIVCLDNPEDERDFMVRVHERGMDTDEYVYMLPDLHDNDAGSVAVGDKQRWNDRSSKPDGKDDLAKKGYEKAFIITVELASGEAVNKMRSEIPRRMKQPPFNCTTMCDGPEDQYGSTYSPYLYDAMYVYALSLNKTLQTDPVNGHRNGSMIQDNCESNFSGMTGDVVINNNGNRLPTFVIRGFDQYLNLIEFGHINVSQPNGQTVQLNVSSASVIWGARSGDAQPLSRPVCGFTGLDCPKSFLDLYLPYVIVLSCIALLLVILSVSGFSYSIYSRLQSIKLQNQLWQVSYSSLQRIVEQKETTLSQSSLPSSGRSNASSLVESLFKSITNRKCKNYEFYFYNGQATAAAKTQANFAIKDETDFAEFRAMRELSHENVNKFIGVCLDGPNFLSLWRYCKRGSLKDVIRKGHLTLDWFFKYSLINDIAAGIDYLANSPLKVHGNITSKTCLVDDRWQVMLSDFGMRVVRQAEKPPPGKLLWTAPEILRSELKEGTAAGDIYSFAIVCSEILTTKKAFEDRMTEDLGPEGVIYHVMKEKVHPFRPSLSNVGPEVNPAMIHLIKDCWTEKVADRPNIRIVRGMLKAMMSGRNANLMDHVMNMMEKYAVTLEQQVEERTKQLVEEQKKSDVLLYRMLPRQVADKLKSGQSVEPEAFDNVTIFFSDVVGFTNIASRCSPLQVVNLLNDLYTLFDGIIEAHDVYKVETIGDGYLCVSGLPHRNGDMHAREIADMSLEFMRSLINFRIHNLPNEQINLRIGLHTGSCVSGIVGMSMPRYCLFGDSVNTASRMESHGKPGQIHITAETNRYLTHIIGGYKTAERGDVIIKGKGVLLTYWLLGKADALPFASGNQSGDPALTQMYESYKASIDELDEASRPLSVVHTKVE
uniref:Guanylate cyclase n=1 Tax=Plectus sambesii TaxID=2011161 RepID=A0A914VLK1_9BILA